MTAAITDPRCEGCEPDAIRQCPVLARKMTPKLIQLCQQYPAYRDKWRAEAKGKKKGRRGRSRVIRYASAVRRWQKAGRPTRDDSEVSRIYETLCRPCDQFSGRGSCKACGCKISKGKSGLTNKIRMATESCPRGKWEADSDSVTESSG